jgi:hypothetical protein
VEGALDIDLALRDALTKAMQQHMVRNPKDSRYQIAAKMSELTRHTISKDMLDKYVSSDTGYNIQVRDMAAFCAVTGSLSIAEVVLHPLGREILDPEESKLLELVRKKQARDRLDLEIAVLERETGAKITK